MKEDGLETERAAQQEASKQIIKEIIDHTVDRIKEGMMGRGLSQETINALKLEMTKMLSPKLEQALQADPDSVLKQDTRAEAFEKYKMTEMTVAEDIKAFAGSQARLSFLGDRRIDNDKLIGFIANGLGDKSIKERLSRNPEMVNEIIMSLLTARVHAARILEEKNPDVGWKTGSADAITELERRGINHWKI